ncbi:MAG: hypothetical protein AB7I59_19065 [Geminicoccaceae bacterium]
MIGIVRTKRSLETFIRLEPLRFATTVRGAVLDMDGVARVMLLVALLSLDSVAAAASPADRTAPGPTSRRNLDEFVFLLSLAHDRHPGGSVARRRVSWLTTAALVDRLGELAARNGKLVRSLQEIWVELARRDDDARTILAHDDTWCPTQARRLLDLHDRYQGREFVTFEMMPKWLFNFQTTRRFLRENDVGLFPEAWRQPHARPLPV